MDSAEASDDRTIGDDAELWRRIRPDFAQDGRISSQAFQNIEGDKMSVFVGELLTRQGLGPRAIIQDHPGYGVASIQAGFARGLGQKVVLALDEGAGHAHLVGSKTKSVRQKLARAATWIVQPLPRTR